MLFRFNTFFKAEQLKKSTCITTSLCLLHSVTLSSAVFLQNKQNLFSGHAASQDMLRTVHFNLFIFHCLFVPFLFQEFSVKFVKNPHKTKSVGKCCRCMVQAGGDLKRWAASKMRMLKGGCFIFQSQITSLECKSIFHFFPPLIVSHHWKKMTNEKHNFDQTILKR